MNEWSECKNLLVVRLDNLGDVLMSVPAINALKETLRCKITLLTSSAAIGITPLIHSIDDVITYDVPWMKSRTENSSTIEITELLKSKKFDGAVVFTVFSQNPLPSVMLTYMAGIPLRIAYCRENPYQLLTDWIPEEEPYSFIRHQVRRDLDLVAHIGAATPNEKIKIKFPFHAWESSKNKLRSAGVDLERPWLVFHPGVSENKREYPTSEWVKAAKKIRDELDFQILLTGIESERPLTESIMRHSGKDVFSLAGALTLEEFIMLVKNSLIVVSVNTATAHIASATETKIVVLYALTNPQHTPWKACGKILPFLVPQELRSKNEVLRYVHEKYFSSDIKFPCAADILLAVDQLLHFRGDFSIPELYVVNGDLFKPGDRPILT